MMRCLFIILLMPFSTYTFSQTVIPLYKDSIPNSRQARDEERKDEENPELIHDVQKPSLLLFLPKKPNGKAVLICPGGGYQVLAMAHEGTEVAKKFNEWGITAFVLKYRIPNTKWMIDPATGPLQDVQQAFIMIRENAAKWKVDPAKLGIMGFSAGGHLASTAATHYQHALVTNRNNTSVRPDFQILVYPVISFRDSLAHKGSRDALLGKDTSAVTIEEYSNETKVDAGSPPCLLIHAADDDAVVAENSIAYYHALLKHKVHVEMHIYQKGGHGFGMHKQNTTVDGWIEAVHVWLSNLP